MRLARLHITIIFSLLLAAAVPACLNLPAAAQVGVTASVHGIVTDVSGAVVPDAKITALDTATGIKTVTTSNRSGYYIFPQLQVGPYKITVTAPGFETYVAADLTLNVNDNREVKAVLKVGATTQTVEVSATAVQVETSNTQLEQIASSEQLEGIPLEGRDPAGLQKLEPGVVESSDRFGTFSSNGSQTAQNSYMVNGVDIGDPALGNEGIQVNPDALEEENIVTSTMNPEFSRNSGATVNQVLKSGTNSLHGSGFELYRDTFLNNGNYLSPSRPVFHQNLYGGTLGGPVFKNKLFFFLAYQGFRNRTAETYVQTTEDADQLAGNFTRDLNYATGAPNSAGLTSNPIPFAIGACAPPQTWAQCFSAGTVNIPNGTWNSVAANLIKAYVPPANFGAPDANGQEYQYNFNAVNTAAEDQGIIKLDYTPTSSDSLWAMSIFQSAPGASTLTFGGGSFPGFPSMQANHYKLFSATWTHTFSPTKLNVLRASYYRNPFGAVSPAKIVTPGSWGFNITPQDPQSGVPYIGVGQYYNLGFSFEGPQPRLDTNLTYSDSYNWVLGNHNLKFGASFEQFRVRNPFDVYNNGLFSFGGGGPYSSGDPLIDFALGIPDVYEQTNDGFINAVAEEMYGYAQDNWKVNSDFTFNYGLGYDIEKPYTDHQDGGIGVICFQVSNTLSTVFTGTPGNTPPPGLSWPGDPGCNSAAGATPKYDHVAPRIGFAWSPSAGPAALIGKPGAHDMSVRAGFGLYFNRDQEEQSLQNLTDPPFVQTSYGAGDVGGSPSFANPFADVTGNQAVSENNLFPIAPVTPKTPVTWANYSALDLGAFDRNYGVPYTYNYNLNIQRSLGAHMVAEVGYVGSVSHRLATWYEGDPITAAGHAACLADTKGCAAHPLQVHLRYPQDTAQPALSPYGLPWYLSIGEMNTDGSSNYNSLQASLRMAPAHGLQFTAAYTYAHALDDGSGYESGTGAAGRVRNYVPGFEYLNYGDSDFDARQRLAVSYGYTVPAAGFLRSNLAARELLAGWGLAGVTALQTGYPIGINYGTQASLWCDEYSYFGCPDVPETSSFKIAKENIRASAAHQYFNTSPFSAEPAGTFGNTTRNFFHGPGFDYTNLQFFKNIPFTSDGKRYLQLRLEGFNVFNHANFANPVGTYLSPSFGQVTSVVYSADPNGDPSPGRAVQISGKFYF